MSTPKQAERSRRILQAALEEFSQAGFAEGSLDRISRSSGVAKTTIYRHHVDKEGLFKAVFELALARLEKIVRPLLDLTDFENSARSGFRNLFGEVSRNRETLLVFKAIGPDPGIQDPVLKRELTEAYLKWGLWAIDSVRAAQRMGQVRQDLDPEHLHLAVLGMIHSFISHWDWTGKPYDLTLKADLIGDILFQGIKPGKPGMPQSAPRHRRKKP